MSAPQYPLEAAQNSSLSALIGGSPEMFNTSLGNRSTIVSEKHKSREIAHAPNASARQTPAVISPLSDLQRNILQEAIPVRPSITGNPSYGMRGAFHERD